jgi:hypothetical protein
LTKKANPGLIRNHKADFLLYSEARKERGDEMDAAPLLREIAQALRTARLDAVMEILEKTLDEQKKR